MSSALRVIFEPHPETAGEDSQRSDVLDVQINAPVNEAVNEATNETNVPENEAVNEAVAVNEAANETNVPENEAVNARQQWFIAQIMAGRQLGWADLAKQWQVSRSTAKRDIADLKARGLIEFVGAPKTGFYQLTKAN